MRNARWTNHVICSLIVAGTALPATGLKEPQLVLKGKAAKLTVEANGGAFTEFRLSGSDVNPLAVDWSEVATTLFGFELTYPWRGHFLCLDRFGFPSERELENGMPFHGEASQVKWEVVSEPSAAEGAISARMRCALPMAGLEVHRTMRLSEETAVLSVEEAIENTNSLGRIYNFVQHANIQRPFLDETVLLDCNATSGFLYQEPLPENLDIFQWPAFAHNGKTIDLRQQTANADTFGVFLAMDDEADYGWVTACNPGQGVMLGYLWKTEEFPWLLVFRMPKNGNPEWLTFEPTTGYLGPNKHLVARGPVLDRPLVSFIDAGETISTSYTAFLAEIPADYKGVEEVSFADGEIAIRERQSDATRDIRLSAP